MRAVMAVIAFFCPAFVFRLAADEPAGYLNQKARDYLCPREYDWETAFYKALNATYPGILRMAERRYRLTDSDAENRRVGAYFRLKRQLLEAWMARRAYYPWLDSAQERWPVYLGFFFKLEDASMDDIYAHWKREDEKRKTHQLLLKQLTAAARLHHRQPLRPKCI